MRCRSWPLNCNSQPKRGTHSNAASCTMDLWHVRFLDVRYLALALALPILSMSTVWTIAVTLSMWVAAQLQDKILGADVGRRSVRLLLIITWHLTVTLFIVFSSLTIVNFLTPLNSLGTQISEALQVLVRVQLRWARRMQQNRHSRHCGCVLIKLNSF